MDGSVADIGFEDDWEYTDSTSRDHKFDGNAKVSASVIDEEVGIGTFAQAPLVGDFESKRSIDAAAGLANDIDTSFDDLGFFGVAEDSGKFGVEIDEFGQPDRGADCGDLSIGAEEGGAEDSVAADGFIFDIADKIDESAVFAIPFWKCLRDGAKGMPCVPFSGDVDGLDFWAVFVAGEVESELYGIESGDGAIADFWSPGESAEEVAAVIESESDEGECAGDKAGPEVSTGGDDINTNPRFGIEFGLKTELNWVEFAF